MQTRHQSPFLLPPDVRTEKVDLPGGEFRFVFHHDIYGELGHVRVLPAMTDDSLIRVEVFGDVDDPMTEKRREILEPITKKLIEQMNKAINQKKQRIA